LTEPTWRIRISKFFWEDHIARDLPGGVLVKEMKRIVEIDVTRDEIIELWSDADYYAWTSAQGGFGGDFGDLARSARGVVAKFDAMQANGELW
jgi:hypothetical protein